MPVEIHQRELYRFALDNHFIIPAFNLYDIESARAIIAAAEETDSPIIAQVSLDMHRYLAPLEDFVRYFYKIADQYHALVMLHHDYLPSYEACKHAVDIGFQSVSFNGQMLTYSENVDITSKVVAYAHAHGALAEAELGNVPGEGFSTKNVYTQPSQAAAFVEETGCDALAVSVGTSHGGLKVNHSLEIRYDLLDEICDAAQGIPLVLHGAASRPREYTDLINRYGGEVEYLSMATEDSVSLTKTHGVAKIYADMDNWLSITGALRKTFAEKPNVFNPMQYMPLCGEAMKTAIIRKIERVTGSGGYGSRFIDTASR